MMSSRHLGQYKENFYIMDEVLIANLPPTKGGFPVMAETTRKLAASTR